MVLYIIKGITEDRYTISIFSKPLYGSICTSTSTGSVRTIPSKHQLRYSEGVLKSRAPYVHYSVDDWALNYTEIRTLKAREI